MPAYQNEDILNWAKGTNLAAIKAEIPALGIQHFPYSRSPIALKNSVTVAVRQRTGLVDKISYRFPKSGVFEHKGVGKGAPIGSQSKRIAKRWFDNPTERNMPELQRIVAEADCTYVVNNLTIK